MKIYLAAPFCTKHRIAQIATEARRAGFTVTSTWHDEKVEPSDTTTGAAPALSKGAAEQAVATDLKQVRDCDVLVLFSWDGLDRLDFASHEDLKRHSVGRHYEAGYAAANHKILMHVGSPESIFTRVIKRQCVDWHEALIELVALRADGEDAAPQAAS